MNTYLEEAYPIKPFQEVAGMTAEALKAEIDRVGDVVDQRIDSLYPSTEYAPVFFHFMSVEEQAYFLDLKLALPSRHDEIEAAKERIRRRREERRQLRVTNTPLV